VLSNFLEGFQGFIRSFRCSETIKLMAKLDKWYEREREAAETRGLFAKAAGLEDKYETAKLLCEQYVTTDEVLRVVKALGEGTTGPTFSTIHKAKGLEHDHVYLLRPDLLPAFFARTPEQVQQEDNLAYVAITRAKETFGYGVRE
jgi:superfamily I DNA/RNA helicase